MPKYFFALSNDTAVVDDCGSDFANDEDAYAHALLVAREISEGRNGMMSQAWPEWTMAGCDENGKVLFSFPMPGKKNTNGS